MSSLVIFGDHFKHNAPPRCWLPQNPLEFPICLSLSLHKGQNCPNESDSFLLLYLKQGQIKKRRKKKKNNISHAGMPKSHHTCLFLCLWGPKGKVSDSLNSSVPWDTLRSVPRCTGNKSILAVQLVAEQLGLRFSFFPIFLLWISIKGQ